MTPRLLSTDDAREFWSVHHGVLGALAQEALDAHYDLASDFEKPFARIFVVEAANTPTGFLVAWHVADELHILAVAVNRSERRKGHGRKLVEAALDYARTNAVSLALLEVRSGNAPAIALYASFGFETTNIRKAYYRDGEDALELMLRLGDVAPV